MFCLDFAFAFAAHLAMVRALGSEPDFARGKPSAAVLTLGGLAGLASAGLLWPFDLVRMSTVPKGRSSFAFSTVPYMGVYLGTYFSVRRPEQSFAEKILLAGGAATLGAAAELPFDAAKLSINMGDKRMAAATTAMRVPLAALLLVSYDKIQMSGHDKL